MTIIQENKTLINSKSERSGDEARLALRLDATNTRLSLAIKELRDLNANANLITILERGLIDD